MIIRKCILACILTGGFLIFASQTMAGNLSAQSDQWQFSAELYGFLPDVEATSPSGDSLEIDIDTLLDNLDFVLMGKAEARKGKLLLMGDLFYYKGSGDSDITSTAPVGITGQKRLTEEVDIDMKNYFMTFAGGYNVYESEKANMDVLLGARYFDLDQEVELNATAEINLPISDRDIIRQATADLTVDGDVWDALIGIQGNLMLSDDWYLTYLADYGGGDSDRTWQVYGALGYKFGWGDLLVGYRHLEYEFDDTDFIEELEYDGPVIGARFWF